jgi:pimeloyl-ACP methyl ester carboxylesterase
LVSAILAACSAPRAALSRASGFVLWPDQVVSLAEMAAIKVPTLVIVGTLDPNKTPFDELKAVLPPMKLVQIEGAPHLGAPARPEFIKAVKEFLAEHPASTDGH